MDASCSRPNFDEQLLKQSARSYILVFLKFTKLTCRRDTGIEALAVVNAGKAKSQCE